MIQLGIFAKTFPRSSIAANLDAVAASGFRATQYNLVCAGLTTLPDQISAELCADIRDAHHVRGLSMAAISATFNIIDPDLLRRERNLRRLEVLAQAAPTMGTKVMTLCTGTCDPHDMWTSHPNNSSVQAWRELVRSMKAIVRIAESCDVTMAIEPELSNVVDCADKARTLLDEIGSAKLKIVFDGANLIDSPDPGRMRDVLDEAIGRLAPDIVLAHAKDLVWQGGRRQQPAGKGMMDYAFYLQRLMRHGFSGPLVLHGLEASDVLSCREFLHEKLTALRLTREIPCQFGRVE